MSHATFQREFCVPAEHPSLPGHFPGAPLVPGVIAMALRDWRGERLARVAEAKFVAPLLPAQEAVVTLTESGGRVRFDIRRLDELLARGTIEGAP
jgi:3-hydroxyacyl-[acyl-carrier-protein] dehydratase